MRHHALPYQAVEGGELDALRPQLAAVAEALGNFAFAGDVRQSAARDTFFKVTILPLLLHEPSACSQAAAGRHGSYMKYGLSLMHIAAQVVRVGQSAFRGVEGPGTQAYALQARTGP